MMEFEINRGDFEQGLALTQGVVERRNTLPILSNVLIEQTDGGVSVLATDLDVGTRQILNASTKGGGRISVNARKLYEIVKDAPGESVRIRSGEQHSVEVSSGKSRFRLVGLDPKEYPSVPGFTEKSSKAGASFQADAQTLNTMIESTLFAVSLDETRINLSGVFMEGHEGKTLRMVATDGHRLAMVDRRVDGKLPEKGVILPRKGLVEAKRVLERGADEAVKVTIDGAIAKIVRGPVELFMRLVDGEFPDYRQVIPKQGKVSLPVPRDELLAALRHVSHLSSERAKGVRITLKSGILEVQTSNPDHGEGSRELEVGYGGDEIQIGFNARYLIDALAVMKDGQTVEFAVSDDVSPGVLRPEGDSSYCYVVMPMRL
jgi:DNA polymerase III subunit beta